MKICFEGPSGIGKTTLCKLFEPKYKIIPEVNELYKGEKNEGGDWYYEKQVARFQECKKANRVIFDGDIFHPLWYNWTYNYPEGYYPLEMVHDIYYKEIKKGNILFPDLYLIFQTSEENLRKRKERDKNRKRSNFEKHLKLIVTQPKYFGFIESRFPGLVKFINYDNIEKTKIEAIAAINKRALGEKYNSEVILKEITKWLSTNKPE